MNIRQIAERRALAKLARTHISHYNKMFSTRQKRVANILLSQSPTYFVEAFPNLIKEPQARFYQKNSKKFPYPSF